jgi:segregation and condensation protein A
MPEDLPFGLDAAEAADDALVLDLDGFEGPLDLLLTLARSQRVDLRRVSILALAEQYLRFVVEARRLRIELAADYLVMAAWLAFLKSRLLLPPPHPDGGPSGEELAARLALRLERLEAIRRAAARLMARPRLGRDRFARGAPEAPVAADPAAPVASLADLLRAYAAVRTRAAYTPLHLERPAVFTLDAAYARLRDVLGGLADWGALAAFLPADWLDTPARRRTATASAFAASLELAKRGEAELRQDGAFAPLWLRRRDGR